MANNKYDRRCQPKHSQQVKRCNFAHIHASSLCLIELRSIWGKERIQEKNLHKKAGHTLNKLMQISGTRFLSMCHPYQTTEDQHN